MWRLDHLTCSLLLASAALSTASCEAEPPGTSVGGGATCSPMGLVSSVLATSTASGGEGGAGMQSSSSSGADGGSAPSSTSGTGGSGGGDATCGCPGDIATHSGTRLEVLSARGVDGSSIIIGLYDTAEHIQCGCRPTLRPDGVWRCVPDAGCPSWDDADLVEMLVEAGQ